MCPLSWYLGKPLSHGRVAQWEWCDSQGDTDNPRSDSVSVTGGWVRSHLCLSHPHQIQGCKSGFPGPMYPRHGLYWIVAFHVVWDSCFLGFTLIISSHIFSYSHILKIVFRCYYGCDYFIFSGVLINLHPYPPLTVEDFLSLKIAYLNHWAWVLTVRLSEVVFFCCCFLWCVGGRGCLAIVSNVLMSEHKIKGM